MWIARDRVGEGLYCYEVRPIKGTYEWSTRCHRWYKLKSSLFPNVKWEDIEPTWVRLIRAEWVLGYFDGTKMVMYVDSEG